MRITNPREPNILKDMQASARGIRLSNPMSKRSLVPHKDYPYSSKRQDNRLVRKLDRQSLA